MTSPNYDSDRDATQHLEWDSTWQPDRDEDYAAVVQEYRRPQVLPQPLAQNNSLPTYNAAPPSYAPLALYPGGEVSPLKDERVKNEPSYPSSEPISQTYAGRTVTATAQPTSMARWLVELVVFILVVGLLTSWGWWPFWLFIFWPLFGGGRNRCASPGRTS